MMFDIFRSTNMNIVNHASMPVFNIFCVHNYHYFFSKCFFHAFIVAYQPLLFNHRATA